MTSTILQASSYWHSASISYAAARLSLILNLRAAVMSCSESKAVAVTCPHKDNLYEGFLIVRSRQ